MGQVGRENGEKIKETCIMLSILKMGKLGAPLLRDTSSSEVTQAEGAELGFQPWSPDSRSGPFSPVPQVSR